MASERTQRDRGIAGYLLIMLTAGAYLPTPLYPGYRDQFEFGDLTMTLLYATFAVIATPTLLLTGLFMNTVGPRPLLRLGIVLGALGSLGFALAPQPEWLFAARAAHGLALGFSTGAAAVILAAPNSRPVRLPGPVVACMTFVAGTAVGPLFSGTLAQYGPDVRVPYLLHLGLLAVGWYRVRSVSRTCGTKPTTEATDDHSPPPPAAGQRPRRFGAVLVLACLTGFLAWTVAGLFLALMPAVLIHTLGTTNTALTGGAVGLVLGWSVLTQPLVTRIGPTGAGTLGAASLLTALIALSLAGSGSPIILAATTVLAGTGHGLGYGAAVVSIENRVPRNRRTVATAIFYVTCYLGSALPAVVAGALSRWHTLPEAVALLAAVTIPIAVIAFVAFSWVLLAHHVPPRRAVRLRCQPPRRARRPYRRRRSSSARPPYRRRQYRRRQRPGRNPRRGKADSGTAVL